MHGRKALSYLGPRLWNNLSADIKSNTNVNTLKHDIKKLFFDELQEKEDDIYQVGYLTLLYLSMYLLLWKINTYLLAIKMLPRELDLIKHSF